MKKTVKKTVRPIKRIVRTHAVATTLKALPEYRCRHCGHDWIPRVTIPEMCPDCHSRNWLTKK